MIIEINKDIEVYKKSVWKGLAWRELVYGGAALVVAAGIVLPLYYFLNVPFQVGIYVALPFTAGIGACGFVSINGMYFPEIVRKYINIMFGKGLVYISTEEEALWNMQMKSPEKKRRKKMHDKKQLVSIAGAVLTLLLLVLAYIIKRIG